MKSRYQLYLDDDLTERFEAHAGKNGSCKSAILTAALRSYLDKRGAKELDDLLGVRLGRLERNQEVMLESLALFIRYQLSVTAPLPEADDAALAIAQERYQSFIVQVGRRIASGRGFKHDLLAQTNVGAPS